MAETTRPALEMLHEVVDAWLRRNERRAATEAAFPDAGPMVRILVPSSGESGANPELRGRIGRARTRRPLCPSAKPRAADFA